MGIAHFLIKTCFSDHQSIKLTSFIPLERHTHTKNGRNYFEKLTQGKFQYPITIVHHIETMTGYVIAVRHIDDSTF